jgi:mannose-6-phosphate isomerase-like protein (cupin superfamily)
MGYHVVQAGEHPWEERPNPDSRPDQPPRTSLDLTTAAELKESRARLWRYPPKTRGRRHADLGQEEVFVVLAGSPAMLLGEPPERFELQPASVVSVEPGTELQIRNDGDEEAVFLVYGAPPVQAGADFLDDPEP